VTTIMRNEEISIENCSCFVYGCCLSASPSCIDCVPKTDYPINENRGINYLDLFVINRSPNLTKLSMPIKLIK